MHPHKILRTSTANPRLQAAFKERLGISGVLAQLLINRGITTPEEAKSFLHADLSNLHDPYSFSDMAKAVAIVKDSLNKKQKVMVFGDYDVDGVTALALLKNTLSGMGLDVLHQLPHRIKDGYGLVKNILHLAKQKNIGLLITADCGINSRGLIEELRRANIEVIVTDHHEPLEADLPPASAIINPKTEKSGYGYRDLAGVGVAYKFCQAISGDTLRGELDLVCLGTVADVVPLTGENRLIVKEGLPSIRRTKRVGLKALIEASGIEDKIITPASISYILGPRINASGRMDTADTAFNLLISEDKDEADKLAKIIEAHNRQRQKIETKIMEEAGELIEKEVNFKEHRIIVVARENWHHGVLGIVAAKLADKFYRPTIIISLNDGLCKGSGRSIKNFHLFKALLECGEFLSTFGGHSHAVGLIIEKSRIQGFKQKINRLAKERMRLEDLLPSLDIDMEIGLADLNPAVVKELEMLEPFGCGNPEPLFYTRNLSLKGEPEVLRADTLKFWVSDNRLTYQAIGFGMGSLRGSLLDSDSFDLVYTPRIDNWRGAESIILEIKEVFFH